MENNKKGEIKLKIKIDNPREQEFETLNSVQVDWYHRENYTKRQTIPGVIRKVCKFCGIFWTRSLKVS